MPSEHDQAFPSIYGSSQEIKLLPFESQGKWGYFDKNGNIVIEPQYGNADYFYEGLAGIQIADKWGYIDETGQIVTKTLFSYVGAYYEGYAYIESAGSIQVINKEGSIVTDCGTSFQISGQVQDGMVRIEHGGCYGYANAKGELVIPAQYKEAGLYSNGLTWVENDKGETYYIDPVGKKIIELKGYTLGQPFSEGLAAVVNNDLLQTGFIDTQGQTVIRPRSGYIAPFSEGLAVITSNRKKGYIEKTGQEVIERRFDAAHPFVRGVALVGVKDKYGFINHSGEFVSSLRKYDYIDMQSYLLNSDIVHTVENGRSVYINRQNGEVVKITI